MKEHVKSLLSLFLPPDPSMLLELVDTTDREVLSKATRFATELKVWYWKLSCVSIIMVLFSLWSISPHGFATVEDVKDEVAVATKAMGDRLDGINDQIIRLNNSANDLTKAVNGQLASQAVEQICRLQNRMVTEPDLSERRRLRAEIDSAQSVYRRYSEAHDDYPEIRCEGL